MIQDTSIQALERIKPDLAKCEEVVFDVIKLRHGATIREISYMLGKESGWVSARISGLREKNKILNGGKRLCKIMGTMAIVWIENTQQERDLFN